MANRVHLLQLVRHKESMQEIVHDLIDEVVGLSDDSAPLWEPQNHGSATRLDTSLDTSTITGRYKVS